MPRASIARPGHRLSRVYRRVHCPVRSSKRDRMIARVRRLFRHQPGARAEEQRGYRRPRLGDAGSSRPRSRVEGDVHRTLALGFGEKIPEARFRYLVLQCDICSEHGGRCLPWGNPHLLAKDFGGSRSREPVGACAVDRDPRPWFLALAALQVAPIGTLQLVAVMHWVALLLIPRRRVALPDRVTDFAGQTKTPDLQEARGARIAQREGQPTIRQTPGHREIDTARRACGIFTGCLLSTMTRTANPASFPCVPGRSQTALRGCITSTWKSQPPWPVVLRE